MNCVCCVNWFLATKYGLTKTVDDGDGGGGVTAVLMLLLRLDVQIDFYLLKRQANVLLNHMRHNHFQMQCLNIFRARQKQKIIFINGYWQFCFK